MKSNQTPDWWEKKGKKEYQNNAYLEAEIAFQNAANGFREAGDDLAAAEMDNNRSVVLLQAGKPEMAFQALNNTPDIFAKAGDIHRQALALGNQAASLEAMKRFVEAAEKYQQASDLLKEIGETELRATVMKSLSELQMRQGDQLDALLTMHTGLQQVEHPSVKQRLLKKLLEIPFNIMNRS
jgi:tetratricopeptide (TPR) repeat protein